MARELTLLFSQVGIPKDLLTEVCCWLQVKHIRKSIYHPQTDGLIKRFNQMLKRILWWVVEEEGRNWDIS